MFFFTSRTYKQLIHKESGCRSLAWADAFQILMTSSSLSAKRNQEHDDITSPINVYMDRHVQLKTPLASERVHVDITEVSPRARATTSNILNFASPAPLLSTPELLRSIRPHSMSLDILTTPEKVEEREMEGGETLSGHRPVSLRIPPVSVEKGHDTPTIPDVGASYASMCLLRDRTAVVYNGTILVSDD
jgi:hypothetical protein